MFVLLRVQTLMASIDKELAESLVAEPRRPDEPFVLEYMDRFIAALQERVESGHPARRILLEMIGSLRVLRGIAEKGR